MDKDNFPERADPIDLSALDPTDEPSFEARIAAIMSEAFSVAPARADLLAQVVGWARPALAAAALIAGLSAIRLLRPTTPPVASGASAAEILGIPAPVARIARVQQGAPVDVVDLAEAFGVEPTHGR